MHSADSSSASTTPTSSDNRNSSASPPTEWRMLEVLVRKPGKLVTREVHLTEVCGGAHHTSYSGYLRLYVGQLRKKLEDNAGVRVLHEDRNRYGGAAAGPEDFASFAAGLLAGSALVPAQVEHDDGAELCDVSR